MFAAARLVNSCRPSCHPPPTPIRPLPLFPFSLPHRPASVSHLAEDVESRLQKELGGTTFSSTGNVLPPSRPCWRRPKAPALIFLSANHLCRLQGSRRGRWEAPPSEQPYPHAAGKKLSFTPQLPRDRVPKESVICKRVLACGNNRFMLYRSGCRWKKGPKHSEIRKTGKNHHKDAPSRPETKTCDGSFQPDGREIPPPPPSGKLPPFLSHPCLLVVYIKYLKKGRTGRRARCNSLTNTTSG